jgi:hypothetical protein
MISYDPVTVMNLGGHMWHIKTGSFHGEELDFKVAMYAWILEPN